MFIARGSVSLDRGLWLQGGEHLLLLGLRGGEAEHGVPSEPHPTLPRCEQEASARVAFPHPSFSSSATGLNEAGEQTSWQASGWAARIVQHEVDHLQGVLYIDKMDSQTFANLQWAAVNE